MLQAGASELSPTTIMHCSSMTIAKQTYLGPQATLVHQVHKWPSSSSDEGSQQVRASGGCVCSAAQVYLERQGDGDAPGGSAPDSSNWEEVARLLSRKHGRIESLHALNLLPGQVVTDCHSLPHTPLGSAHVHAPVSGSATGEGNARKGFAINIMYRYGDPCCLFWALFSL